MEKFSPVWTKVVCFGFMLLKIELTNGAVNIPNTGTPYIGNSFKLECHITPFTGTANWDKDGTPQATCGTTFCAPATLGNYTFSYDGTGISVTIDPVSTSDGGSWQCTHTSGIDSITLTPTVQSEVTTRGSTEGVVTTERPKEGNNPCKGVEKTTIVLCITDGAPVVVEVIIVIIIIIIDTQKVKIIVTAKKEDKQLKSAKQKINNGVEKTVNVKEEECSIDVRGEDLHACVFKTDAAMVGLDFKITDDLLNVKPGSAITVPTVLLVKPDIFNKQWSHDGKKLQSNALLFHTIVTKSTYGVYGLNIMFDNLGLDILIKNMRVQARNWIIIMICVVVNVPLALIGGGVTEYNRSTDGFCVDVEVTILAFVGPIFVYSFPVMGFIYIFFLKKTGNEKNSGNLKGKTSNESSLAEDKEPFKEISGRNNLLTPLRKETNSAQN